MKGRFDMAYFIAARRKSMAEMCVSFLDATATLGSSAVAFDEN